MSLALSPEGGSSESEASLDHVAGGDLDTKQQQQRGNSNNRNSNSTNVNKEKNFEDVLANKKCKNTVGYRTRSDHKYSVKCNSSNNSNNNNNIKSCDDSENTKKKSKAVKVSLSPLEDKENVASDDEVFSSSGETDHVTVLKTDWPKPEGKRQRRSSETADCHGRKVSRDRGGSPPPLRAAAGERPRGILKRRGRSYSESHIGSVEECLGEELLVKYGGSVEQALVEEYGCLEGLLEECGWQDEDEADDESTSLTKKNVTFNDVEKTHLFLSKTSIVTQLANDSKRAMRVKMKEQKKKMRIEKRQAQKNGSSYEGSSNSNSSYRNNSGYNSYDDEVTTEESDGAELGGSTTSCDTTEEEDTDSSDKPSHLIPSFAILSDRSSKMNNNRKKCKKNKTKRVNLTNNMIFQLDMEA